MPALYAFRQEITGKLDEILDEIEKKEDDDKEENEKDENDEDEE